MPVLQASGLVAGYGDAAVVNAVSLYVDPGEIVAIMGPNGAGKSTLIKALLGLVRVQAGTVSFRDQDITGLAPDTLVRLGIGYVPQSANVFPALSARENLELMLPRRQSRAQRAERIEQLLMLFPDLRARLRSRASVLSGGERQMLALARALVVPPALLILDEPTAALAPRVVARLFEKILEINSTGIPLLLVEQNARLALAHATRGYVLEGGRNAISGPAPALLESAEIGRLYLGDGTSKATRLS
jgi:ABC-type branched-subunit amino acid transport system ATPase component